MAPRRVGRRRRVSLHLKIKVRKLQCMCEIKGVARRTRRLFFFLVDWHWHALIMRFSIVALPGTCHQI
jgi:hypothetical protein